MGYAVRLEDNGPQEETGPNEGSRREADAAVGRDEPAEPPKKKRGRPCMRGTADSMQAYSALGWGGCRIRCR